MTTPPRHEHSTPASPSWARRRRDRGDRGPHPDHRRIARRQRPRRRRRAAVDRRRRVHRRGAHAGAGPRQRHPPLRRLLREHKAALGELVSIEAGKIRSEGSARCRR